MSLQQEFIDLAMYTSVALWLKRLVAAVDTVALKAPFQKYFFPFSWELRVTQSLKSMKIWQLQY